MKKLVILLFTLMMFISTSACNKKENKEVVDDIVGLPNPVVYYDSLEEINEKIDVQLLKPSLSNTENETFAIIDNKIAQYTCTSDKLEWVFRAAHITNEDISGMYNEYNVFEPKQDSGLYVNEFYLDRFFDGDKQYTIVVKNPISKDGKIILDEEAFSNCCMSLKMIQQAHFDDPLVGTFVNVENDNFILYVERFDKDYYATVNLYISDTEFMVWSLNEVKKDGDKLTYKGEEIGHYAYDENGNEIAGDVFAQDNQGYFEIVDEKLCWRNAALEKYQDSLFKKLDY